MRTKTINRLSQFLFFSLILIGSCAPPQESGPLPFMGRHEYVGTDTILYTVPDFDLVDQEGRSVNKSSLQSHIYVVDDFFTSCPTICPKVKQQELRLAEQFSDEDRLKFLSISIDYIRDSVPRLKDYAEKLEIDSDQWHLCTGDQDHIYDIVEGFFLIAIDSTDAPGGFDHSGALILVDSDHHIRAVGDGTDPESVDQFKLKIDRLLKEMDNSN